MDLSLTGNTQRPGYGRFPSIGVNNIGIVVEIHQTTFSYLYYAVGVVDDKRASIEWGDNIYMDECGDYPKIAVNDNNQVIEVHESQGLRRGVWYRYGTVNVDKKKIEWEKNSTLFDGGKNPAVALGNDGKLVIVYERARFGSETFYWIGKLKPNADKKIDFVADKVRLFLHARDGVTEMSIAINGKGYLIAAGRGSSHKLVYIIGKFANSGDSITWQNETEFDMGSNYPSVGLDDNLRVVSLQQSNLFREVSYRVGKVSTDSDGRSYSLTWCSEKKTYDHGTLPVISLSNDGTIIVEEHETQFSMLGLTGNKLFNRICSFKE